MRHVVIGTAKPETKASVMVLRFFVLGGAVYVKSSLLLSSWLVDWLNLSPGWLSIVVSVIVWFINPLFYALVFILGLYFLDFQTLVALEGFGNAIRRRKAAVEREAIVKLFQEISSWLTVKKVKPSLGQGTSTVHLPPGTHTWAIIRFFYRRSPTDVEEYIQYLHEEHYATWVKRRYGRAHMTVLTYYYFCCRWLVPRIILRTPLKSMWL